MEKIWFTDSDGEKVDIEEIDKAIKKNINKKKKKKRVKNDKRKSTRKE